MRSSVVAALLLLVAAGCTVPTPSTSPPPAGAAPEVAQLALHCGAANQSALEFGALGSCWGHYGHHTYLLDRPVRIEHINGTLTAVEAEVAGIDGPAQVAFDVSTDGIAWAQIAAVDYPYSGTGLTEERHTFNFSVDASAAAAARLLRLHMPHSKQQGLAGYLDNSDLRLWGRYEAAPPPLPRHRSDCAGGIVESFFASHPCWFGGYDATDQAPGSPDGYHLATKPTGTYYDAPSFLHTHAMWGVQGAFQGQAKITHFRTTNQFALCGAEGNGDFPLHPTLLVHASTDGTHWTEVARSSGDYGAPIDVDGQLPTNTTFVRFVAAVAPGDSADPACHHPVGLITDSRVQVA